LLAIVELVQAVGLFAALADEATIHHRNQGVTTIRGLSFFFKNLNLEC